MPSPYIPTDKAAKSGDVALAGKDGRILDNLIQTAQEQGTAALSHVSQSAIARLVAKGPQAAAATHLFDAKELVRLGNIIASAIATGDLLGRTRIREMHRHLLENRVQSFAESDRPFAVIQGEELPLLSPQMALDYFRTLVPRLGVDPILWAPMMQRTAFTLAAATEKTLLNRVQELLLNNLRDGQGWDYFSPGGTPTGNLRVLLDEAGVTPKNPQYSQMVFRTNTMDAYNIGYGLEMADPEISEFFPVWQYLGIRDGREGDDHRPKFNRYYPNSLHFAEVRGKRVWNCRCTPRAVDKFEWADLYAKGARAEYVIR